MGWDGRKWLTKHRIRLAKVPTSRDSGTAGTHKSAVVELQPGTVVPLLVSPSGPGLRSGVLLGSGSGSGSGMELTRHRCCSQRGKPRGD